MNGTDKNMGACNADKIDAIKECDRKLQEPDIHKKLLFEKMKKNGHRNPN